MDEGLVQEILIATRSGNAALLREYLLSNPENSQVTDGHGWNILHEAVHENQFECVQLIIELAPQHVDSFGDDAVFNETPLYLACLKKSNFSIIKALVEATKDINIQDTVGRTALHVMAREGNPPYKNYNFDVIQLLLSQKASTNIEDTYHYLPLHYAIKAKDARTVKILLQGGTNIKFKDCGGASFLSYAARSKSAMILRLILERDGSAINKPSNNGMVPIMETLGNESPGKSKACPKCFSILKDAGADLNLKDGAGLGLLHLAAIGGNLKIVAALVDAGLDVMSEDNCGRTPLYYAICQKRVVIVKWLIKKIESQCNPKALIGGYFINHPLFVSVFNCSLEIVRSLLHSKFGGIPRDAVVRVLHRMGRQCFYSERQSDYSDVGLISYLLFTKELTLEVRDTIEMLIDHGFPINSVNNSLSALSCLIYNTKNISRLRNLNLTFDLMKTFIKNGAILNDDTLVREYMLRRNGCFLSNRRYGIHKTSISFHLPDALMLAFKYCSCIAMYLIKYWDAPPVLLLMFGDHLLPESLEALFVEMVKFGWPTDEKVSLCLKKSLTRSLLGCPGYNDIMASFVKRNPDSLKTLATLAARKAYLKIAADSKGSVQIIDMFKKLDIPECLKGVLMLERFSRD